MEDVMPIQVEEQGKAVHPYAWVVLWVALLAGVTAPLNQFKAPPVMPVLMDTFHFDLTTASLLMSIFAITGLILALPAGIILQKLGVKTSGLIALGSLTLGSLLGAAAPNGNFLLASRLIEGIGMGLIAVVSPAAIAMWFPPEKRSLPMGIWATWVPLGSLLIYVSAPVLAARSGWQAVWWVCTVFSGMAMCLYGWLMRMPGGDKIRTTEMVAGFGKMLRPYLKQLAGKREIWLLALSFGCYNLVVTGVIATFFPTFLKSMRGYDLASASFITSVKMLVVVFAAPAAGWILDRTGKRKKIFLITYLVLIIYMAFPFTLTGWMITGLMVLLGIIAGIIATITFSTVPEIMGSSQLAGMGMGIILFGQTCGQLVGPLIFSRIVESSGWTAAGMWMMPVLAVGMAAAWLIKMQ
jgi:MFS family permease